jgi:hypothetical protein
VFGDMHYLMALAAAGRANDATRMIESLSRYAAESGESEAAVARDPGLALARAVLAHRAGDLEDAVTDLAGARDRICRIGGSHAQRDLFEQMLIDSALRGGKAEEARALLAERCGRRPRNAWGWRQLAKALDQLGEPDVASRARDKAMEIVAPR